MKTNKKVLFLIVAILLMVVLLCSKVEAKTQGKPTQEFANIVLFAEFSDNTGYFSQKEKRDKIIEYYEGSSNRSFKNYIKNISYGQLQVNTIFPQDDGQKINPVILPYTTKQANEADIDYSVISTILRAVPEIQNQVVDYNGDGLVDNLTIILHGKESTKLDITPTLYPHKANYEGTEKWSGKSVSAYNILNTGRMIEDILPERTGVIIHEFMHTLGYPDLYTKDNTVPVGIWDIMAASSMYVQYPLAYLRQHFTNWITIDTITSSQTLTLNTQDNPNGNQAYILKSPLKEHEFFVIEFRKKTDSITEDLYDSKIGGSGIIVYRVDTTVEGLSNLYGRKGIYVFRPQSGYQDEKIAVMNAYLSRESGRTSIGQVDLNKTLEEGALTYTDGTNSGIVISEVSSSAGNTITCKVTIPEKSDFDLWEDTKFPSKTGETWQIDKNITIAQNGTNQYAMALEDGKFQGYVYENGIWKSFGNSITVSGSGDIQLINYQGELYFAYSVYTDISSNIQIKRYDGTSWKAVGTVNDAYSFQMEVTSKGLYLVHDVTYEASRLKKIDKTSIQDLGEYYQGMCGQPKIAEANGKIYVSVRNASNNQIEIYYLQDNSFIKISNEMVKANSYDMKGDGNKLYVLLGGTNLVITSFDGAKWEKGAILENANSFQPILALVQGKIYAVNIPATEDGQIKVYAYQEQGWVQEGNVVDSNGEKITVNVLNGRLYISYFRKIDRKLFVKSKKVEEEKNELLSISVTVPNKVDYIQGEKINKEGLQVTANYTKGTKVLNEGEYQIKGFDTSSVGTKVVTITYQGKSASFAIRVKEEKNELLSISVTAPNKVEYIQGEKINKEGLQVTANYTKGTKVLNEGEYQIKGFDTSNVGTKVVTITYQGKSSSFAIRVKEEKIPDILYRTHVQDIGWQGERKNGEGAGTTGQSLRLEAIKMQVRGSNFSGGIRYRTHVQDIGWQEYVSNNQASGTTGRSLRLEAIQIELTEELANRYDIYYRVHVEDYGWLDWAKNGEMAGSTGYSYRLEAIQVKVVKKGQAAPGNTKRHFIQRYVNYKAHVQDRGWQGEKYDGEMTGTTGASLRMEALQIRLADQRYSGGIRYRAHVQDIGWQGYVSNNQMIGTTGKSLRMEAMQIELTGEMAMHYDIYYRVHIEKRGWQNWKKNGEIAGTTGQSLRLEAIEIKLVEK